MVAASRQLPTAQLLTNSWRHTALHKYYYMARCKGIVQARISNSSGCAVGSKEPHLSRYVSGLRSPTGLVQGQESYEKEPGLEPHGYSHMATATRLQSQGYSHRATATGLQSQGWDTIHTPVHPIDNQEGHLQQ